MTLTSTARQRVGLRGTGGGGQRRARSDCRFVLPRIHFIPYLRTYSVPLFLKQQCDRTLDQRRILLPDGPRSQLQGRSLRREGLRRRRAAGLAYWGSVALSLCTAAHPRRYTIFCKTIGISIADVTMRPNPISLAPAMATGLFFWQNAALFLLGLSSSGAGGASRGGPEVSRERQYGLQGTE